MSPVIIDIDLSWLGIGIPNISVRWYGLMYVVAIIVGIVLVNREVKRRGMAMTLDDILDFVLITIPIAIIFARLYYVLFSWHYYGNNLGKIIAIWEGGLAIHGGLIGGVLALWLFSRWKKVGFWKFADVIAPAVVLGQALGRFGNFMNGDAYGIPTDLPWGIIFPGESPAGVAYSEIPLHPTMLYELAGDLLIFGLLMVLRNQAFRDGFLISVYAILYSVERFVVEIFRGDPLCLFASQSCSPTLNVETGSVDIPNLILNPRVAQVISLILIIFFMLLVLRKQLYKRDNPDNPEAQPPHGRHAETPV